MTHFLPNSLHTGVIQERRRQILVPPNAWRECLSRHQDYLTAIQAAGGVRELCCPSQYSGSEPPWIQAPRTARRFQEQSSVVLGNLPAPGTDSAIITFEVPQGMDGVLSNHFQMYTGAGFIEGSGDIAWRIRINRTFLKDYSNMETSLGNNVSPIIFSRGGIRVSSQDEVSYIVNLGPNALVNLDFTARIAVSISGYYYPQE